MTSRRIQAGASTRIFGSQEPAQPASIGPAVAGPVVAAGMPPTGEAVVGAEPPSENELASEAELALEREAKKTGAHHTR